MSFKNRNKYWWIKERDNPQLGTYYVPCGNISVKEAKAKERSKYGFNYMHRFDSEAEYEFKIQQLLDAGHSVQGRGKA